MLGIVPLSGKLLPLDVVLWTLSPFFWYSFDISFAFLFRLFEVENSAEVTAPLETAHAVFRLFLVVRDLVTLGLLKSVRALILHQIRLVTRRACFSPFTTDSQSQRVTIDKLTKSQKIDQIAFELRVSILPRQCLLRACYEARTRDLGEVNRRRRLQCVLRCGKITVEKSHKMVRYP